MWYSNLYRRHLMDMHIDDWDESFLSRFSPEEYVENLKRADINVAMLYYQSHAGLCYYPTKIGVMHRAFRGREDMMLRVERLCREAGIKTVGYYSPIYNTREHDRHPEWRLVEPSGLSRREKGDNGGAAMAFASTQLARYGLCCPNNLEYRQFVFDQIDEMLDYFSPDGMFFDMPFWPGGGCYCKWCRDRWAREEGGEMPVLPGAKSPDFTRFSTKKFDWMDEFVGAVVDHVKKRNPNLSVEFNHASAVASGTGCGCGEGIAKRIDYSGGDLYGNTLSQSVACKLYYGNTRNQPYEYMFSRCKPSLRTHTMTKSQNEMRTAMAVTAANHGATLVIDAIDPVGTMDRRVYEAFGKAFSFVKPYESYFRGKPVADVGIYYGVRSRHDVGNDPRNNRTFTSIQCVSTAAKTLTEHHIPYGITGNWAPLEYPYLIAPVLKDTEVDVERLVDYVRDGGTLYFSGADQPTLLKELVGGELVGYTAENKIYIAPKKRHENKFLGFNAEYPLFVDRTSAPIVKGIDRRSVVATITLPYTEPNSKAFASIHSDPPGRATQMPAVVIRDYGKGRVIWSAVPIEGIEEEDYGEILLSLLMDKKRDFAVRTDAPEDVEITLFRDGDELLASAVQLSDRVKERTVPSFRLSIKCEREPKAVRLLPDGTPVKFSYKKGYVTFRARILRTFDMYSIEL